MSLRRLIVPAVCLVLALPSLGAAQQKKEREIDVVSGGDPSQDATLEGLEEADYTDDPITANSMSDMVKKVLAEVNCEKECIGELWLHGHGQNGGGGIQMGSDLLEALANPTVLGLTYSSLDELKQCLCEDARVVINACNAGARKAGARFVYQLAKVLDVKVSAPVGLKQVIDWPFADPYVEYTEDQWQEAEPDADSIPDPIEPERTTKKKNRAAELQDWLFSTSFDDDAPSLASHRGQPAVYVTGAVHSAERTAASVRGPGAGTIRGHVVEVTTERDTMRARPNAQGQMVLDWSRLTTGTDQTRVTLRLLDPNGQPVASARTRVLPGAPSPPTGPPRIDQVPRYVEAGRALRLAGRGIGSEARVLFAGEQLETLAASSREIVVYPDRTPGTEGELVVENDRGWSNPRTVRFYRADVRASKRRIAEGEQARIGFRLRGLDEGAVVEVINERPDVVSMDCDAPGAGHEGNTIRIPVAEHRRAGGAAESMEFTVTLTGESGAPQGRPYRIRYEVRPTDG